MNRLLMTRKLLVIAGPDKGRTFELKPGEALLLGRSQATQTRLTDPRISRVHAEVQVEIDRVVLVDSNSAAGTLVNGERISQHVLRRGDVIQVGETQLRFEDDSLAEQSTLVPTPARPVPAVAADPLSALVGQTLGRFEIGAVLAKGQSAAVFRARDSQKCQEVALKVLRSEFAGDEEQMQRFVRAMKTVLPLRHPNLVTLFGAGKTGAHCWIAMEYVEGESLTQVIQRIGVAGMLDWRHALRIAIHVGRALDYAHGQQIIHRNVAPPNILLRSSDKLAKLGDLMLAKALDGALALQVTRPGELVGDVNYMSPERTKSSMEGVDGRSDLFSLGATTYALLTGRPPFADVSLVETITKLRKADPEKPKKFQMSIPDLFEGTVLRMLAKRPEDRYQTAAELLKDLERVAKYQGVAL
jgi:pSer/pThr/pTyr-binding forkhead associated (FHA) protein